MVKEERKETALIARSPEAGGLVCARYLSVILHIVSQADQAGFELLGSQGAAMVLPPRHTQGRAEDASTSWGGRPMCTGRREGVEGKRDAVSSTLPGGSGKVRTGPRKEQWGPLHIGG